MALNIAQPTADPTEYFKKNPAVSYSDYFTPRYTSPSTSAPATPLATATSTPTAPPIPSPIQTYYESLNKTAPTVQDEESIREGVRKQMQSSIDAIEAQYSNIISREQVAGEDRSGQTRAINARSGLIGSDFGQANQDKTTDVNKQAIKSIQDEKNLRIQGLYEKIDNRAREEIQARKAEALGNAQQYIGYLEKAQAEARGDLKDISKSGAVLSPDQKAALQKQAGYDDFTFESIINANKPKASQVDYQFKIEGGKMFGYGIDPTTGELKTVEKDLGIDIPNNYKPTVTPDGTLILTPETFDPSISPKDQIIVYGQQGQFAKPEQEAKPSKPQSVLEYEYLNTLTPEEQAQYKAYQNEDANRKRSVANTYINSSGLNPKLATQVQTIAGQFDNEPIVRQYNTIAETVNAVKNAGDSPTDDIQRVYAFAKVADPNSAVREGEYKTVQDYATSLLQRVGLKANRVFNNDGFLTDEARGFINTTLTTRLKSSEQNYNNVYKEYGRRINKTTGQSDGNEYLTNYGQAFDQSTTASNEWRAPMKLPDERLNQSSQSILDKYGVK